MRNRITNHSDYPTRSSQQLHRAIIDREYVLAMSKILGYVPARLAPMLVNANHVLRTLKSPK